MTDGPQNVIFSYEGIEPIGPKLVYLNKKSALYRMTETKCFRDAYRDQLHELSGQSNTYEKFFFSPCKFLI